MTPYFEGKENVLYIVAGRVVVGVSFRKGSYELLYGQ